MFHRRQLRIIFTLCLAVSVIGLTGAAAFQLEWRDYKDWIVSLEDEDRLAEIRMEDRLAPLNLKPGDVVADIGAGTGVFSRAFARAVGPTGRVYAEDIQQGLIDYINKRSKEEGLTNLTAVLGDFDDPKLPTRDVDLAWFHDVFHAVEKKENMLRNLVSYMKPKSRIALTEWDKNDPAGLKFHDSPDVMLSQEEAAELFAAVGFYPIKELEGFSLKGIRQWYIIYERR
jgi:ubiquinone/menaquinone biosynthesis C-methylase UbiE